MADTTAQGSQVPNLENGETETPKYLTEEEHNIKLNGALARVKKEHKQEMADLRALVDSLKPPQTEEKPERVSNAEMAEIKKQLAQVIKERDTERSMRRDKELRDQVNSQLRAAGIPETRIKAVAAQLIHEDKAIFFDENDQLRFRAQDGDYDLADGFKLWSKTAEAKEFISPQGKKGSGDKRYNAPPNRAQASTQEEADQDMADLLIGYRLNH